MYNLLHMKAVFYKRFCNFIGAYILLLVLDANIQAASLQGYVTNQNALPIPYVYIENITQNDVVITDEDGYFISHNKSEFGDTLQIYRIGFTPKKNIC